MDQFNQNRLFQNIQGKLFENLEGNIRKVALYLMQENHETFGLEYGTDR